MYNIFTSIFFPMYKLSLPSTCRVRWDLSVNLTGYCILGHSRGYPGVYGILQSRLSQPFYKLTVQIAVQVIYPVIKTSPSV